MISEAAQETNRRDMVVTLIAALLAWMFDGFEMGLFPLIARTALMELIGPGANTTIGTWISIIIAGFLIGATCGGIVFGWLGDRIGRVRAMVWSVATYSIFSGLCVFVTAPWQMAVLRFVASLGMGGEWSLGVALVMETWPSKYRTMLAALIGIAAQVGFLLIALMGLTLSRIMSDLDCILVAVHMPKVWIDALLANSGWRMLMLIGGTPLLLAFFIYFSVPESKRWRHASAIKPKNRVRDIFDAGLVRVTIMGAAISSVALLGTWGSAQWIPSWADRLSNQLPEAKSLAQISASVGAVIGCFVGAYLAQWTNRRCGYFLLCVLSLAACSYLFRMPMRYGSQFLFMVFVVGGLTASFFGWLPLYLPELFPTHLRATGQGFAFNCGRILAAAGTLGAGHLLNYFREDYAQMCAVISLVYALGVVFIWFCPETKGQPLPE